MTINWNLAQSQGGGGGFGNAMAQGMQMGQHMKQARDQREMQGALAAFATNPDDPAALQAVMARDPRLGMQLAEFQDQRAFRSALGDYMTNGGGNAMLGAGSPTPSRPSVAQGNALGSLPDVGRDTSFNDAFAPLAPSQADVDQMGMRVQHGRTSGFASGTFDAQGREIGPGYQPQTSLGAPAPAQEAQPGGMDLTALGEPQNGRDRAFLAMVRRDPLRALEIQSTLRDNFVDRLKAEHEFYGMAVQELSRVQDQTGWQSALSRMGPLAQALGADMSSIPTSYPGPDGVNQLMESALPVKERLDYLLREGNLEADNARADRNTDSMIDTREGRLSEYQRNNQERSANQRRGQNLTDSRAQARQAQAGSRPRARSANRSGGNDLPVVSSSAEARRLPPGTQFKTPDGRVMRVPAR